ncbi:MAG: aspartyl-tRNA(Asn)/glutamyl-tRNA(Gln) amidotransferase subunit C [Candidatus Tokpelaia sp. JSC189]|nr:MAG: aspartyl-tRNA(Asn)/glutamyl-tRNA(Gln) amidotransferase subunit C [Candidatus Tokpelaia sp. JSC189]
MSVDLTMIKNIAHLARIALNEKEAQCMSGELTAILGLVEQLDEVDVTNVEPITSIMPMILRMREDVVTDGSRTEDIVVNAPVVEKGFFLVPKVIE